MEQNYILYGLFDPITHKCRYIGITKCSLNKRLNSHCLKNEYKHNLHKSNWINQLKTINQKPKIVSILSNLTNYEACKNEKYYIKLINDLFPKQLTNIHEGGNLPPIHKGPAHYLFGRKGINNPLYKKFRGSKNHASIKIKAINLKTNEQKIYESVMLAAEELNIFDTNIHAVLKGKMFRAKDYTFEYIDKPNVKRKRKLPGLPMKKIKAKNIVDNTELCFISVTHAAKHFLVSRKTILRKIQGYKTISDWNISYI